MHPRASVMTEIDRANRIDDLDRRHDELLAELESLGREVEAVLRVHRPPSPPVEMAAFVDGPQQPQAKRRAKRHAE
jgi:hypothetical protein